MDLKVHLNVLRVVCPDLVGRDFSEWSVEGMSRHQLVKFFTDDHPSRWISAQIMSARVKSDQSHGCFV